MKKVLVLVLTVAMILSMTAVVSFAIPNHFNVDAVYGVPAEGEKVVLENTELLGLVDEYKYIRVYGWFYPEKAIKEIGYVLDGADPVYDEDFSVAEPGTGAVVEGWGAGWEDATTLLRRVYVDVPVLEGAHTFTCIVKFIDDTTLTIGKTYTYGVAKPKSFDIYTAQSDYIDFWLGNGNPTTAEVKFYVTASFSKIKFPNSWGPNGDFDIKFTIERDGEKLAEVVKTLNTNPGAFEVDFGQNISAGEVTLKFDCLEAAYFVLPKVTTLAVPESYVECDRAEIPAFSIIGDGEATEIFGSLVAPTFHGASFDTFYINDAMPNAIQAVDGGASGCLDAANRTVDGSDGSINTISFRGWIGFDQEIEALGYMVDGKLPVWGEFTQATEDAVRLDGNGGQYATRFKIDIPVADLKGAKTIVAVAKVNGRTVAIDDTCPTVGAATCPNTKITYLGEMYDACAFTDRSESPFENASWIGNGPDNIEKTARFNAATAFTAVTFPQYWAGSGERAAELVITLTNEETGEVYTSSATLVGDNAIGGSFALDKTAPAGVYTMVVDLANKEDSTNGGYFVIPWAKAYDEHIVYSGNAFAFGLKAVSEASEYFVEIPVAPAPTADASLVIFALAACAMALVILKKKVF